MRQSLVHDLVVSGLCMGADVAPRADGVRLELLRDSPARDSAVLFLPEGAGDSVGDNLRSIGDALGHLGDLDLCGRSARCTLTWATS